jgi:hypothetical protein
MDTTSIQQALNIKIEPRNTPPLQQQQQQQHNGTTTTTTDDTTQNLASPYSPITNQQQRLNYHNTSNYTTINTLLNENSNNLATVLYSQQHPKLPQQPNKVRKRSANQAYEYLIRLNDSKTFQEWLVNNETDFTWVHKRNSMTNAGKKYYYICNYRKKRFYKMSSSNLRFISK